MSRSLLAAALLVAVVPAFAQAPSRPARPLKLGQCVACHGEDGRSRVAGTPHLAGQDETYLVNALNAYRSGSRRHVPMSSLANTLQPRDIAALAKWYAGKPGFASSRGTTP